MWTQQYGTTGHDCACEIELDFQSNIFVVGNAEKSDIFTELINPGGFYNNYSQAYLAKYDPSGDLVWSNSYGISNLEQYWDLSINNLGDIYVLDQVKNSNKDMAIHKKTNHLV